MDNQEKQEEQLQIIADTKDPDCLSDAADEIAINEDPDCQFHAMQDGIEAGLRRTKKKCWTIELREQPGVEASFDEACYGFFIGKSFDEVKKRIENLPNR